jgi:bacillithiol synthase
MEWASRSPELSSQHREALAEALLAQASESGGSAAAIANIELLREGAAAVVTGQQVGLFGGPLLTLLKAATAIRKAKDATEVSGRPHVPIFWLASEDHDLAEVDQVEFPGKTAVEKLRLELRVGAPQPVGSLRLDGGDEAGRARLEAELDHACELLGWAPICDALRECYAPGGTLAGAFGRLIARVFAEQGLIVLDAASRAFHGLGAAVLRAAIERADELEEALLRRSKELVAAGYHAQVLVTPGHSLLFVVDGETGARVPLRRVLGANGDVEWKAGARRYSAADLLGILESEPERLSPNALLRPVFQDGLLPTAAYVGGPAEIAYFAQSAVLYERILGRVTPVLPRLSATLVPPAIAGMMAAHEIQFSQILEAETADDLALRMGARALPIEAKRKLAAAGNSMDGELTALTEYMAALSPELGRAANVSASKMLYQMNRLRRMAASFELERNAALRKQAGAIMLNLLPEKHLQERVLAGVWFLGRFGEALPELLVGHAGQECPGHRVIFLD